MEKLTDFLLFKQLPIQGNKTFEVYHTWMWVPVAQEDGTYGGLWNATVDTTKKVLAERRLATVREMGERTCRSHKCMNAPRLTLQQYPGLCTSLTARSWRFLRAIRRMFLSLLYITWKPHQVRFDQPVISS